jgi:hypothetical protein
MAPDDAARKVASAHTYFCEALVQSLKLTETVDQPKYQAASKNLDLASRLYMESGLTNAANQALARRLLLDAIFHLNQSREASELKGETQPIDSALVSLNKSAQAFNTAHQHAKKEEVIRFRDMISAKSRLSLIVAQPLRIITDPHGTVEFLTPERGGETPMGLDRFERSDLETRIIVSKTTRQWDQPFEITLDITNVGNRPARLLQLDGILADGLKEEEKPQSMIVSGQSLICDRQIDPLKTETLRFVLNNKAPGLVVIRPKVIFLDGNGVKRRSSCESKTIATSPIVEFLANSFVKDYDVDRLASDACGWRTLMDVVKAVKVPRSHLYGEPRYGRVFGRQLEALIQAGIVESRVFHGERGRGGRISKVRIQIGHNEVKTFLHQLSSGTLPI